jgi:hypothetical protein
MKKKLVVSLLSLSMALSMLVGCGSSSSDTSTSKSNVEETQTNESQETSTIVEEESSTQEEVEGDIVFYDEPLDFGYTSDDEFKEVTNYEITSTDDEITLYDTTWKQVGYLKEGVSVTVVEESASKYKVINPVEGTDYDYFYIDKSCVPAHGVASNIYTVDEFLEALEEQLKICYEEDDNASKVETTIVDSPDNLEKGSKYAVTLAKEALDSDDETANLHGIAKRFYGKYSEIYIISASNEDEYDLIEIDFKCNLK